jgi:transcriptional regulator
MAFKTDLEALVLGSLQEQPLHGYEISKRISAQSQGLLKIGEGQLYPALHKLEERGLIEAEWVAQEGKPNRKTYSLTAAGSKELDAKRHEWKKFSSSIGSILLVKKEAH